MELMRQQATNFGTRIVTEDVVDVDFAAHPFKLTASDGNAYESLAVIVATGTGELHGPALRGQVQESRRERVRRVRRRAARFRNKPLVVVGGGDSAVEEADYVAKFASVVYMVHRRDQLRASKIMADRAKDHPKIEILWNRVLAEVLGDDKAGVTGAAGEHRRRAGPDRRGHRRVPRHRPHAEHGLPQRQAGTDRQEVHRVAEPRAHLHQRRRRLRRRRRGRRLLPPSHHRRRQRLHGRTRRGTLVGGAGGVMPETPARRVVSKGTDIDCFPQSPFRGGQNYTGCSYTVLHGRSGGLECL